MGNWPPSWWCGTSHQAIPSGSQLGLLWCLFDSLANSIRCKQSNFLFSCSLTQKVQHFLLLYRKTGIKCGPRMKRVIFGWLKTSNLWTLGKPWRNWWKKASQRLWACLISTRNKCEFWLRIRIRCLRYFMLNVIQDSAILLCSKNFSKYSHSIWCASTISAAFVRRMGFKWLLIPLSDLPTCLGEKNCRIFWWIQPWKKLLQNMKDLQLKSF